MQKFGYKKLAKYYDKIYAKKDYDSESRFVRELLERNNAKTVLDVGCGTGGHLAMLEKFGFECTGIDLNQELLDVAKQKLKAQLVRADMTNFDLAKRFDAIICMFATFNHNLSFEDAKKTLRCFKNHLNKNGIILIDLHNPSGNGKRKDKTDEIEREIEWEFNKETRIEKSKIKFKLGNDIIEDSQTFRIYTIEEMRNLLEDAGFANVFVYEGYGFNEANPGSKNLEAVGINV